ncbi:MAG: amidohydrolase family protein [Acidimicrobiales bacterium]
MTMLVDVHTHMLSEAYVSALRDSGGRYSLRRAAPAVDQVYFDDFPFMTLTEGMFDYDLRVRDMDRAGVDMAIVSLTCPNVFWGGEEVSLAVARAINDDMRRAQAAHPDRIRWMASIPWQYPDAALTELESARAAGAIGVMTLANVSGEPLVSERFAPVWEAIELAGLPVLVHPTAPLGIGEMGMEDYNLVANVGFMFDTTLAFTRMIYEGFLDRFPRLKLIASHAGATLPYIAGRLDRCWSKMPACRTHIDEPPSSYLRRLYYDTVTYSPEALALCLATCGGDRLLFGSDYPHNIGDMEGCRDRLETLAPRARDAARGGNAQAIFRL